MRKPATGRLLGGALRHLYVQVLIAIVLAVLLGWWAPELAVKMKPLGDGFIKAIKLMIAPIIFCTVVQGIAGMNDLRRVGRVGIKALVYFEVVTTVALAIGLVVSNLWRPGDGMNIDPATLDTKAVAAYTTQAAQQSVVDFLLHVIPAQFGEAFASGEIIPILFLAILFGFSLFGLGAKGAAVHSFIDQLTQVLFRMVGIIMRAAPIGAFGAMAFTIGRYGVGTLLSLGQFMAGFYLTCVLFVLLVLGLIARWAGFSILRFIAYLREELLIVLGTSSSESALPRLMAKLEQLGCDKSVVGLVVPTGYSFNLDGTCIYLTLATLFLAQATNTPLSLLDQLGILAVLLLTSKGAAAVTGGGFITLAATLGSFGHVPVASIALILGIDRFMSEARALTNLVGNGVAAVVIAKWEGALDSAALRRHLARPSSVELDRPELQAGKP